MKRVFSPDEISISLAILDDVISSLDSNNDKIEFRRALTNVIQTRRLLASYLEQLIASTGSASADK